jgi:hypothetical protein
VNRLKELDIEDCMVHINQQITPEIEEYATDDVFLDSRYIFTTRKGKKQFGYCTHCHSEYLNSSCLIHGSEVKCPVCQSVCIVKSAGRGHETLVDEAYFTYYEKSIIDPQVIVAKGIYAVRDYSVSYREIKTQYYAVALYVFVPNIGGTMLKREWFWYGEESRHHPGMHQGHYVKAATVHMLKREHFKKVRLGYSLESIAEAIKGTPFQYSTWENYDHDDMTAFFDLYARYPCVEYLTKLDLDHLVTQKMDGYKTHGVINWRGKSLLKVLKLSKQEFNEIRQRKIFITYDFLHVLQTAKKNRWDLSIPEILDMSCQMNIYFLELFQKFLVYGSPKKIFQYLKNQFNRDQVFHSSKYSVLTSWRDYLDDCEKLKMDPSREEIIFPKSLYRAHQNTIERIKLKENKGLDKQIKARVKKLQKYCFECGDLLIRPANSYKELLAEGNALSHCVASYGKRYAEGKTIILFIRKRSEPNQPFYTVEIIKNDITQVRGHKNCAPTPEVKRFMEAFESAKLGKKIKVRIPA